MVLALPSVNKFVADVVSLPAPKVNTPEIETGLSSVTLALMVKSAGVLIVNEPKAVVVAPLNSYLAPVLSVLVVVVILEPKPLEFDVLSAPPLATEKVPDPDKTKVEKLNIPPLATVSIPALTARLEPSETPALFATDHVPFVAVVNVPALVIVCAALPFRLIVPALAGLKFSVPVTMLMLPFMLLLVPVATIVKLAFKVKFPLIVNPLAPAGGAAVVLIIKLPKVFPSNTSELLVEEPKTKVLPFCMVITLFPPKGFEVLVTVNVEPELKITEF